MVSLGFPLVYQQAPDLIDRIGEHVVIFGKRPIVVMDEFVHDHFRARLNTSLKEHGISAHYFIFSGEPSPEAIGRIVNSAKKSDCDFAIGMGGGKVLDASKAVKLELAVPIVIIPSIASNDASTSRLIITYKEDGTFLGPLFLDRNPDAILVDTTIIATAPKRYLVAGMGDALATWFEAQQCHQSGVNNFFGGSSGETPLALSKLCYCLVRRYGVLAIEALGKGQPNHALEKVVEANVLLSGLGFEGCGVAAAHAFSQGFTLIPELHGNLHGEEVAVGLIAQLALEQRSDDFINDLLGFYKQVNMPCCLKDLGLTDVTEEHLKIIAEFACRDSSRMHNMSFPVTIEAAIKALLRTEQLSGLI